MLTMLAVRRAPPPCASPSRAGSKLAVAVDHGRRPCSTRWTGRIARLLNGQSKFGEELDSLSDVVSFGVAPAITLYLWVLAGAGTPGWIAVLGLERLRGAAACPVHSSLGDSDLPPYAYNYFTGVPAPAGGGFRFLLPLVFSFEAGTTVFGHPLVRRALAGAIALLMVSQLPTFSFKGVRVPPKLVIPLLAGVGLIAAMLVSTPWLTLSLIGIAYLISLPFSYRQYRRLRREAEKLHASMPAAAAPTEEDEAAPFLPEAR